MSHKAAALAWGQNGQFTAIGGRRFTRSRGRIVCYERSESVKAIGIEECDCGISAPHPSYQIED